MLPVLRIGFLTAVERASWAAVRIQSALSSTIGPTVDQNPSNPYLRHVNFSALDAAAPSERVSQRLIDRDTGATACMISYIRTPAGGGSASGMHFHEVDQHFYVLEGVLRIEVAGRTFDAGPGSLVHFPAGVPHKNWNEGDEPAVHLAINAPLPPDGEKFGIPVP